MKELNLWLRHLTANQNSEKSLGLSWRNQYTWVLQPKTYIAFEVYIHNIQKKVKK